MYMTTIDTDHADSLLAIDAQTGEELMVLRAGHIGLFTPAVVDGVICVAGNSGLLAIDAASGELIWSALIGEGFSAPAVGEGMVVVHTRTTLVAVDAMSGEELWRYATGGSWSSPTLVDGVVHVGSNGVAAQMGLHLIDAQTGEQIAQLKEVGTMNAPPVVTGGGVYAAGDGGLFAFGPASAAPATPNASSPAIGPFVLTTGIDQNNQPVDEVTSHPTVTAAISVVYDFAGVTNGADWRMVWTVDGEVIYDGEAVWSRGEEGRAADWIPANEGALPDGTCEVVLYIEGVERQRGTVTIGG